MKKRAYVKFEYEVDNTQGYTKTITSAAKVGKERHLSLDIWNEDDKFYLEIATNSSNLKKALGDNLGKPHLLHLTLQSLEDLSRSCCQKWEDLVIKPTTFRKHWDLSSSSSSSSLAKVLPQLAEAGYQLFMGIFNPLNPDCATLKSVGKVLSEEMTREEKLLVKVNSDKFHIPWNLIYSSKLTYSEKVEPQNVKPEGFWGYQHLFEHSTYTLKNFNYELQDKQKPLVIGIQLDENIDQKMSVNCLQRFTDCLDSYSPCHLKQEKRNQKIHFRKALANGELTEHILYFCCHNKLEESSGSFESHIVLTDRPKSKRDKAHWITPSEIHSWLGFKNFSYCPLVFLNICDGGQFAPTRIYKDFGPTFLGHGACSVIGPLIDIPAIFAGEFASRFFEEFFRGGQDASVGEILYKLRYQFFNDYKNPLGMVYSLYRGADIYLKDSVLKTENENEAELGTRLL